MSLNTKMHQWVPFDVWTLIFDAVMMNNDDAKSTALRYWKPVCKTFNRVAQVWQNNMITVIKSAGFQPTLTTVGVICNMCKTIYLVTGIPVAQLKSSLGLSKCYCFRCVVNKSDKIRQANIDDLIELSRTIRILLGGEDLQYKN